MTTVKSDCSAVMTYKITEIGQLDIRQQTRQFLCLESKTMQRQTRNHCALAWATVKRPCNSVKVSVLNFTYMSSVIMVNSESNMTREVATVFCSA